MPSLKFIAIAAIFFAIGAMNATAQPPRMVERSPSNDLVRRVGMFDWLFGGAPRRPNPPSQSFPQRHDENIPSDERERPSRNQSGTYRTMCVRLCDGFYFPIS